MKTKGFGVYNLFYTKKDLVIVQRDKGTKKECATSVPLNLLEGYVQCLKDFGYTEGKVKFPGEI